MDSVAMKLSKSKWPYADQDDLAFWELARRIAAVGRSGELVSYSDLVRGLTFHMRSVNEGKPFAINTQEWSSLDRAILGDFLGRLCAETYPRGSFMGSALAVTSETRQPSEGFWSLMRDVDALQSAREDDRLAFWSKQVEKAQQWYQSNEWG